mmetsp:Transcript_4029/g.5925  ORF Transcript_4029/g.5925 Transcript_4029/m.5925 type:complete len:123 (-) Transcript_4029:1131-1499(-)
MKLMPLHPTVCNEQATSRRNGWRGPSPQTSFPLITGRAKISFGMILEEGRYNAYISNLSQARSADNLGALFHIFESGQGQVDVLLMSRYPTRRPRHSLEKRHLGIDRLGIFQQLPEMSLPLS